MPELAPQHTDIIALGVIAALALLIASNAAVRRAATWLVRQSISLCRRITSLAARILDLVLPIKARNASVSWPAVLLWTVVNIAPVAGWAMPVEAGGQALREEFALVTLGLCSFNILFLTGAYWALKEGIDFMNADTTLRQRLFRDLSTATNMPVLVITFVIVLCQVALMQHWLQTSHGLPLVVVRNSVGIDYIDHLTAVLASVPVVSFLLALPGVARRVAVEVGWGALWAHSIAAFGSMLLISTFLGFVQQHAALKRMLERVLLQPEGTPVELLLRQRLLRAPSIVKRNLREAYRAERDDGRRLRLLALALEKRSFSAPSYFLRSYRSASASVQANGAVLVAAFLTRHAHRLDREAAREIVAAALAGYQVGAFGGPEHLLRAGAIVLPCLGRLAGLDGGDHNEGLVFVRQKPIQAMLCALIRDADEVTPWKDAALLLLRADVHECLPEIHRALRHAPQDVRLRILQEAGAIVGDSGMHVSRAKDAG